MAEVFEYRGVRRLMYAPILTDDNDETGGYTTGEPRPLSPVAEIGRTTETSNEAHYYDNIPMIVVSSTGADELTLTIAPPSLKVLADITGQTYDADKACMIEGERETKYFAIGYVTKGTDGKERYVWRYKGTFAVPDETFATENDGTDTNNIELTFTGISTTHKFEATGKTAKAMVIDSRLLTDERLEQLETNLFEMAVLTPDNWDPTHAG